MLDLGGSADAGYVTHFTVSLWDVSFNALSNASPVNGSVLDLAWLPDGLAGSGAATAIYQSAQVDLGAPAVSVPEPATAWLIAPALAVLCVVRRRRS
jgi:hypothetical protein